MRLEDYQIQQIQGYLDEQSIWYNDIKEEILDHIISFVEQRTEASNEDFVVILAEVLSEVDIPNIQRQKAAKESKVTLSLIAHEMLSYLKGRRLVIITLLFIEILVISETTFLLSIPFSVEGLAMMALIPFISLHPYFKSTTLLNSVFNLRAGVIITVLSLSSAINALMASSLSSAVLSALYYCALALFLMAAFQVLKKTYHRIKLHGAY